MDQSLFSSILQRSHLYYTCNLISVNLNIGNSMLALTFNASVPKSGLRGWSPKPMRKLLRFESLLTCNRGR